MNSHDDDFESQTSNDAASVRRSTTIVIVQQIAAIVIFLAGERFVIRSWIKMLADFDVQPPRVTKFAIGLYWIMASYWPFILGAWCVTVAACFWPYIEVRRQVPAILHFALLAVVFVTFALQVLALAYPIANLYSKLHS